jgi:chaperone required for assembly of F1-ATPase
MRDIFGEIFAQRPLDPTEAARRAVRPRLRARFYEHAMVGEGADVHPILLDGRPVYTPARNPLAAPSRALAEAVASEWEAQTDRIDPARMPLTRLANTIVDGVAAAPSRVADEVERYLGSDLLLYRAEQPEGLVQRQMLHWDPVLAWARDTLGARFVLSQGVVFVQQPEQALTAIRAAIPADPWRLGAVHAITTLTGSGLLALTVQRGRLSADEAWTAAHIDEDWQMERWGQDALALERRAFRWAEMQAAVTILRSLADQ